MRVALVVLAITIVTAPARAHVTPSVDDNNRFLKLTPLGDRVRLAYTVLFGDTPGQSERAAIDTNHDGTISEDEAHAFGAQLAAQVAAGVDLEVDGKGQKVAWTDVDVGMGTPQVTGGSFSIDLVTYPCLGAPRLGPHRVRLRDHFRLTRPGRTDVKIEDSPGVTVDRARIGDADASDFSSVGPGGPLDNDGLDLRFTVDGKAPAAPDATCAADAPSPAGHQSLVIALALAGAAVIDRKSTRLNSSH